MEAQKTLKSEIRLRGPGLHTGCETDVIIKPAAVGTGVVFVRRDLDPPLRIRAAVENVAFNEGRQTALRHGGAVVKTIEHLMSALNGLGIDNALIEIWGEELPGFDGSALEFVSRMIGAGFALQGEPRNYLYVKEPVYFDEGGRSITVLPYAEGLKISYTLSYQHPDLSDQFFSSVVTPELYERELAPARTFCLNEEAKTLQAHGLGRGATWNNTLVFKNNAPINNRLRFENEACRHKIIDLLGDLYLLGQPLRAHVIGCRSGHRQNIRLVSMLRNRMEQGTQVMPEQKEDVSMSKGKKPPQVLGVKEIEEVLPHRYPFLFVDRIIELVPGKKAVGVKSITINEPYFQGHFPGHPVMPGVLILEALAQVGGVLMLSQPENRGKLAYFMTIENAKFRQPVHPGDQLRLEAEVIKIRSRTGQCAGKAFVDGKLVCEAEVKFALVDS